MTEIKFVLNGTALDPQYAREFTGFLDGTTWEDLTEQERVNWLLDHKKEEWRGKPIFIGDTIDSKSMRVVGDCVW